MYSPIPSKVKLVEALRTHCPGSAIVMVSAEADPLEVRRTLAAGASAWVLKADAYADLGSAIASILEGEPFVSARLVPWR